MSQRDDFDGGGLLALLGLEDEDEPKRPPDRPSSLQPQRMERPAQSSSRREVSPTREVSPPALPARSQPPRRRAAGDLRGLRGDELVRAIVLSDVLGPPPGLRGRRRR